MTSIRHAPPMGECRRGGNRLPEGHPARGRPPRYERCRALPDDPERRDRQQRERTRRAAAMALDAGELPRRAHAALMVLLDLTDQRCSVTWHSLATIGRAGGGYEARTAGRWMAELVELGWLHCQHRYRVVQGRYEATTNLWRIDIPDPWRQKVLEAEGRRRKEAKAEQRAGDARRYTPPRSSRPTIQTPSDVDPTDLAADDDLALAQAKKTARLAPETVELGRQSLQSVRDRLPGLRTRRNDGGGERSPP